ncbi:MAG: (2Fe-2S)-binding protein [Gemmatimonadaceae bacterium]|nr:(2Fe-2S)-binding protein [Gemmatimonadaceae bacterium]
MEVKLKVNGEDRTIDVEKDMPLLWAIRDVLKLTGTKFGCGQALCGACTVHVNGAAVRSCITPASSVSGQSITTIEGLATDASHPLQKMWVELGVPQCGYCQPGQIMQAASLLSANKAPTSEAIEEAMNGNICRCGTYMRIREAIKAVAANMPASAEN